MLIFCLSAHNTMKLVFVCLLVLNHMTSVASTSAPTCEPSAAPSQPPSLTPSVIPTVIPTVSPSLIPTVVPTVLPSDAPTTLPSVQPTVSLLPTVEPSLLPSALPSLLPSLLPSAVPTTTSPTVEPTTSMPTVQPTLTPTAIPSIEPSNLPTVIPSLAPTVTPTLAPSLPPTYTTIVFKTTVALQNVSSAEWSSTSEVVVMESLAETLFINTNQIEYVSESARQWESGQYQLSPVFKLTLHTSDYYSSIHNASALYGAVTSTMRNSAENGGFVFAVKYYAKLNHDSNMLNITAASFSNTGYTVGDS